LHILDTDTGVFVGRVNIGGNGVSAPLLVAGDTLLVQANNGLVSAFKIQ
jgi:hypothetical protein